MVDSRDDQLGIEALDETERGEAHAVDRRPLRCVANAAVIESDLFDPKRFMGCDLARKGRAIAVGGDRHQLNVVQRCQRGAQRLQPFGFDPIVVGEKNLHRALKASIERGAGDTAAEATRGDSDQFEIDHLG